ncbi:MAG: hypothetical protein Q9209_004083 [Squamulea sp. 1 TL-2023]
MDTSETPETQKKNLFEEIYGLDVLDDSVNDVDINLATLRVAKPEYGSRTSSQSFNRRRTNITPRQIQGLGRTVSAPTWLIPVVPKLPPAEPLPVDDDLQPDAAASPDWSYPVVEGTDPQFQTTAGPKNQDGPIRMAPAGKGKRKRGQTLEVLPEAQQIFRGLRFYFLPDDDVAPARKLRITKVLERGAIWIKHFENDVTHIIVDKSLTYNDLLKYLKRTSIPVGVNPDQALYHVRGRPQKDVTEQGNSAADLAADSLPLKPAKHADAELSPILPRTKSSEQRLVDKSAAVDTTTNLPPRNTHGPGLKPQNQPADALDRAIEDMIAVKDLPLDDEDFDSPNSSMTMEDSDDEDSKQQPDIFKAKNTSFDKSRQPKFTCMEKHTGTENQTNPNARTIEVLKQMTDYYDRTNDHWRTIAYRKAIAALKKQTRKITTKEEALAIPFIGSRLAIKIEEIVFTNRLRRLENTNFDATDAALQLFLGIYGVGHSQANLWINQGYRTLDDLLTRASLTKNQKIGIEHIEDFTRRIPRTEVEHHGRIVRDAIRKEDSLIEITIGGSYRRGAPDSGDVDFIITKPDASIETLRTIVLDTVIPALFQQNYLQYALATTSPSSGSKWHGCATLPHSAVWHRVDFLLVPHEEIGAALIYFTGNDIFNRSIRLLASRKGMRLNQRGLWKDVMRGKNRERITQGVLVEGKDERRIFEVLGVPWRPPEHRVC